MDLIPSSFPSKDLHSCCFPSRWFFPFCARQWHYSLGDAQESARLSPVPRGQSWVTFRSVCFLLLFYFCPHFADVPGVLGVYLTCLGLWLWQLSWGPQWYKSQLRIATAYLGQGHVGSPGPNPGGVDDQWCWCWCQRCQPWWWCWWWWGGGGFSKVLSAILNRSVQKGSLRIQGWTCLQAGGPGLQLFAAVATDVGVPVILKIWRSTWCMVDLRTPNKTSYDSRVIAILLLDVLRIWLITALKSLMYSSSEVGVWNIYNGLANLSHLLTDLLAVNYWCLIQDLSLRQWLATGLCRSDEGGKPGRKKQWLRACFSKVGLCFRHLAAMSCFIFAQGPKIWRPHCEVSGVSTCALANPSLGVHASFRDPTNYRCAICVCQMFGQDMSHHEAWAIKKLLIGWYWDLYFHDAMIAL